MLTPHVCLICEKIIFEYQATANGPIQGPPSIINLFQKISVAIAPDQAIAEDSIIPKDWAVYATWRADQNEDGDYDACIQLFYPNGKAFGAVSKAGLKAEAGKRAQAIFRVLGFPIGQIGQYKVEVWLERNGTVVDGTGMEDFAEVEISRNMVPMALNLIPRET